MEYLQAMIDRQLALYAKLDPDPALAWAKDGFIRTLLDEADGLIEEAVEFKRALPHKKWKRDYGREPTDHEVSQAKEEAIDCLHFALNLCIRFGYDSAESLYAAFADKNDVNHKRHENKY